MKLKYITLCSLFVFVAFFATLVFLPADTNFLNFSNNFRDTNLDTLDQLTPGSDTSTADNNLKVLLNIEEISKHNTANDCYLIVKGSVYSVATFIDKHSGGKQRILDMCGKEASTIFSAIHSNFAWNLLKDFYIGKIGSAQVSAGVTTTTELNTVLNKNNFSGRTIDNDDNEDEDEDD